MQRPRTGHDPLAPSRVVPMEVPGDPYAGRSRSPREYFSDLVDDYRAHRPGYPDAALDVILGGLGPRPDPPGPSGLRVADVGCGTASAAAALVVRGADVLGIDPSEAMLAEAARAVAAAAGPGAPGRFRTRRGTAEATGLEAASVDLVLCAQSFHWFDEDHALAEFARILVPGGRLALAWNVREPEDEVARRYDEIVERARGVAERDGRIAPRRRSADPSRSAAFVRVRRHSFPNPHPLTEEGLLGRARSTSSFPAAGPERERLTEALRELFHDHARDGRIVLAQRTEVTLADRID